MIRFFTITAIAAIAVAALASDPANAGSKKGGVQIKGSAVQLGLVQQNNNISLGKGAKAVTRVAGVTGDVKVGKDLIQLGLVKNNNNIALGENAEACSEIATLGSHQSACN